VGVVVRRDDECGMLVKENNDDEWSSDSMVFYLEKSQNGDTVQWWVE
jgi:hypothetical protein